MNNTPSETEHTPSEKTYLPPRRKPTPLPTPSRRYDKPTPSEARGINLPHYRPPYISLGTTKKAILSLLAKGGNPHSIHRQTGLSKSTVVQHLRELANYGLAVKGEQGKEPKIGDVWRITEEGNAYLGGRFLSAPSGDEGVGIKRPHNIKVKFPVMQVPSEQEWTSAGWSPRKNLKRGQGNFQIHFFKRFGEFLATFTGKHMILQLPPMLLDPDMAIAEAGRIAVLLKEQYERETPGLKLGEHEVLNAQLMSQSQALVNDPFAQFLVKNGITIHGKVFDVDASKGQPELEFNEVDRAQIKVKSYENFIEDIAKGGPTVSQITELIKLQAEKNAQTADYLKEIAAGQVGILKFIESIMPKQGQQVQPKPAETQENSFGRFC